MIKLISTGNRKIAKNTAIFNLNSGTDCPMKDNCFFGQTKKCYALKAERLYKNCLPYRRRQSQYWNNTSLEIKISDFLEFFKRKKTIEYLRINEAGDLRNVQDLKDLDTIAGILKAAYNINTYTYTHNLQAISEYTPKNLTVNLSIDSGNDCSQYRPLTEKYNVFVGLDSIRFKTSTGFHCPGSGCMSTCKRCATTHKFNKLTVCKIH